MVRLVIAMAVRNMDAEWDIEETTGRMNLLKMNERRKERLGSSYNTRSRKKREEKYRNWVKETEEAEKREDATLSRHFGTKNRGRLTALESQFADNKRIRDDKIQPEDIIIESEYNPRNLRLAIVKGRLDIVQEIITRYKVSLNMLQEHDLLYVCCQHGQLDTLKFFVEYYALSRSLLESSDIYYMFIKSCKSGVLELVEYISDTFNITSDEAQQNGQKALKVCLQEENYDIATWIVDEFLITKIDIIKSNLIETLYDMYGGYGDNEACQWVFNKFHIRQNDLKSMTDSAQGRKDIYYGVFDIEY